MNSIDRNHKTHILICDDDKADIKILKSILKSSPGKSYIFYEGTNTSEIEKILIEKKDKLDLIFLDYQMPEKSGIEWLEEIRESNFCPIIMLTGRGDESTAVEAMKLGASEYLPKDTLDKFSLFKTITNATERWELENERNALLGIAAHEFRNPLTTIIGYTQMLQSYDDIDVLQKEEMLSHIAERANHILFMINDLLDVTRIGLGTIKLDMQNYDLLNFLNKKTIEFQLKAKKKNIIIQFKPIDKSISLNFDVNRIDEVISNLVDNAIKFSSEGKKIVLSAEKENGYATIKIIDEGPGIKESELKYLFKLFSNVNISTQPTAGEKSTGFGLAICKKIVLLHMGKIDVESEIQKGTTFIVKLPIGKN